MKDPTSSVCRPSRPDLKKYSISRKNTSRNKTWRRIVLGLGAWWRQANPRH